MLGWLGVEDGGRFGRGPAEPLALPGPIGPPGVPRPGAVEADCAVGLLAGREGGVDIWFCCNKGKEPRIRRLDGRDSC